MSNDFEKRAATYQQALPGIIRATLMDFGIAEPLIDKRMLGWDGAFVTVPIRTIEGRVAFFERWDAAAVGTPVDRAQPIELYDGEALNASPERIVVAEGIHEALILESRGVAAVSANGSGRFFKGRTWAALLAEVPEIVLAYRRGKSSERSSHLLSRCELWLKARAALPGARVLEWPRAVGDQGGAFEFFVSRGRGQRDFEQLLARL